MSRVEEDEFNSSCSWSDPAMREMWLHRKIMNENVIRENPDFVHRPKPPSEHNSSASSSGVEFDSAEFREETNRQQDLERKRFQDDEDDTSEGSSEDMIPPPPLKSIPEEESTIKVVDALPKSRVDAKRTSQESANADLRKASTTLSQKSGVGAERTQRESAKADLRKASTTVSKASPNTTTVLEPVSTIQGTNLVTQKPFELELQHRTLLQSLEWLRQNQDYDISQIAIDDPHATSKMEVARQTHKNQRQFLIHKIEELADQEDSGIEDLIPSETELLQLWAFAKESNLDFNLPAMREKLERIKSQSKVHKDLDVETKNLKVDMPQIEVIANEKEAKDDVSQQVGKTLDSRSSQAVELPGGSIRSSQTVGSTLVDVTNPTPNKKRKNPPPTSRFPLKPKLKPVQWNQISSWKQLQRHRLRAADAKRQGRVVHSPLVETSAEEEEAATQNQNASLSYRRSPRSREWDRERARRSHDKITSEEEEYDEENDEGSENASYESGTQSYAEENRGSDASQTVREQPSVDMPPIGDVQTSGRHVSTLDGVRARLQQRPFVEPPLSTRYVEAPVPLAALPLRDRSVEIDSEVGARKWKRAPDHDDAHFVPARGEQSLFQTQPNQQHNVEIERRLERIENALVQLAAAPPTSTPPPPQATRNQQHAQRLSEEQPKKNEEAPPNEQVLDESTQFLKHIQMHIQKLEMQELDLEEKKRQATASAAAAIRRQKQEQDQRDKRIEPPLPAIYTDDELNGPLSSLKELEKRELMRHRNHIERMSQQIVEDDERRLKLDYAKQVSRLMSGSKVIQMILDHIKPKIGGIGPNDLPGIVEVLVASPEFKDYQESRFYSQAKRSGKSSSLSDLIETFVYKTIDDITSQPKQEMMSSLANMATKGRSLFQSQQAAQRYRGTRESLDRPVAPVVPVVPDRDEDNNVVRESKKSDSRQVKLARRTLPSKAAPAIPTAAVASAAAAAPAAVVGERQDLKSAVSPKELNLDTIQAVPDDENSQVIRELNASQRAPSSSSALPSELTTLSETLQSLRLS